MLAYQSAIVFVVHAFILFSVGCRPQVQLGEFVEGTLEFGDYMDSDGYLADSYDISLEPGGEYRVEVQSDDGAPVGLSFFPFSNPQSSGPEEETCTADCVTTWDSLLGGQTHFSTWLHESSSFLSENGGQVSYRFQISRL